MPIYEFSCQNCGTEFETMRSFSDSTEPVCPSCASANVQRRLSRPAIHFKGSGWYINDSKNNGKSSSTGGSKANEGEGEGEVAKPSETKTDGEKSTETKSDEAKSSDAKSSDAKSSETKSTETKSTETKSTESKTKSAESSASKA